MKTSKFRFEPGVPIVNPSGTKGTGGPYEVIKLMLITKINNFNIF